MPRIRNLMLVFLLISYPPTVASAIQYAFIRLLNIISSELEKDEEQQHMADPIEQNNIKDPEATPKSI